MLVSKNQLYHHSGKEGGVYPGTLGAPWPTTTCARCPHNDRTKAFTEDLSLRAPSATEGNHSFTHQSIHLFTQQVFTRFL